MLSILNEFLLDVNESGIDYDQTVFALVMDFLRTMAAEGMPAKELCHLMYRLALSSERSLSNIQSEVYAMRKLFKSAAVLLFCLILLTGCGTIKVEDNPQVRANVDLFLAGLLREAVSGVTEYTLEPIQYNYRKLNGAASSHFLRNSRSSRSLLPNNSKKAPLSRCFLLLLNTE